MKPWTVEAWLAFLDVASNYAWPALALVTILIFRVPLYSALSRLVSITKDGAKLEPPIQSSDKKLEAWKSIQKMDFSSWEPHLSPWLDPIKKEVQQLEGSEDLRERLMLGVALAQRRADFIDVWRQMFGSQARLMWRLYQGHRLNGVSIREAYTDHVLEADERALPIEGWSMFLTNFALATGDHNGMDLTIYGQDFVTFCMESGFQPADKAY